jgi:hypothetical protein
MTMQKQERVEGKLQPVEIVDVWFRDRPHSALLRWKQGARKVSAALYVEGQNDGMVLVRPSGLLAVAGVVERDPEGADARQSGRYPLTQYGLKKGLQRTRVSWVAAQQENALTVEYLGRQAIPSLDSRPCFALRRTKYSRPETDGVTDLTVWIDVETWLQVGVLCKGAAGEVLGEYYFRDVRLNPEFTDETFTRKALTP